MKSSSHVIRTPDQRLRVFVSSTLQELADERVAARAAIERLHLSPVMFELGARPHPPKDLYRAYLDQSHIFIGLYWQRYGWVAPDMTVSGLEDEYNLSGAKPKLIYIKSPAPDREPRLKDLLERIKNDRVSYKYFTTLDELRDSIENDLAMILSESFEAITRPIETLPHPAPRHNLPASLTQLVGREVEVQAVQDLLAHGDARLVTLTGPGGTGKSRLALQVAWDTLTQYTDGVRLVSLAPVTDANVVASIIATTLEVRESAGTVQILEGLKNYLRDKHLLLLLDNFEQVVEAAPLVAELLNTCPRLKILCTSRVALRIRNEREYPVPTLRVPPPDSKFEIERLLGCTSVQLFVLRARDVKPSFALTPENAAAVAQICRYLDGLPLAIELAAVRIKMLSPQALLARLQKSLDVLSGGARDLPERQQTLRKAIDWSYALLSEAGRKLLRRLAVFVGGWSLEAMEAVCNFDGDLGADVLDELSALVDNSLIRPESGGPDEVRYGMLGTIREYARERLIASEDSRLTQQRHAEYMLALANTADEAMRGPDQAQWFDRVEMELENFRAAHDWLTAQLDCTEDALQLAAVLGWFWFVRGHWSEGRSWLCNALDKTTTQRTPLRARALISAALLAVYQNDMPQANAYLEECRLLAEDIGDKRSLAYALALMGMALRTQESLAEAREVGAFSVTLFRELDDKWGLAYALHLEGMTVYWQGDYATTRALYQESIRQFEAIGDKWRSSGPLSRLGDMAYREGDYAQARELYERSLALYRELKDQPGIASVLNPIGDMAHALNDMTAAQAAYAEALALYEDMGDKQGMVWANVGLGQVAQARGDLTEAQTFMENGLALLPEVGDSGGLAWVLQTLGYVKYRLGNVRGAVLLWQMSLELAQRLVHEVTAAFCLPGLGMAAARSGHGDHAARILSAALALRQDVVKVGSAFDVIQYDALLAEARTQVTQPVLEAAWTLTEAATLALQTEALMNID